MLGLLTIVKSAPIAFRFARPETAGRAVLSMCNEPVRLTTFFSQSKSAWLVTAASPVKVPGWLAVPPEVPAQTAELGLQATLQPLLAPLRSLTLTASVVF